MAHILVADDDPVFVEITALMLENHGHVVTQALDGDAALRALTTEMDVALIDIFMPVKNGLEVIIELRQTRPDLRIIAVSSMRYSGFDQLGTAKAFGAHATLAKPIRSDGINALIESLLTSRSTHSDFVS